MQLPDGVPIVTQTDVTFLMPDPHSEYDGVRLELDFSVAPADLDFSAVDGGWQLVLPRPAVGRFEYQFTLRRGQDYEWTIDPANPASVPNPFGAKSEVRFPDYEEPHWLDSVAAGSSLSIKTRPRFLSQAVPVTLWSPEGLDPRQMTPLLIANDGSDMADRGSLLGWATAAQAAGPFRVALLDPPHGLRDEWYAANPAYADEIVRSVLPAIRRKVRVGAVVGLGASLGGLAMVALQARHPAAVSALAVQSGSYFTADLDAQESDFYHFAQICSAVTAIAERSHSQVRPVPVLITCGVVEENFANNLAMAAALAGQGYELRMREVADAHTMIGWRDCWSPDLEELLIAASRTLSGAGLGGKRD
ncbi:esterase [Nakamurella antarctica]|uniref:Esterase n=1 Tax=Nakamurella antarctica TaxID=1902245 RepID=A0A3G8ZKC1_9ACTN|nr:esterase [Nakamurella antarctica]AZI57769.1 esterase [Nakamurella antarctica]